MTSWRWCLARPDGLLDIDGVARPNYNRAHYSNGLLVGRHRGIGRPLRNRHTGEGRYPEKRRIALMALAPRPLSGLVS